MTKEEMRHRIQEGFFELAPEDMFEKILEAVEEPVENENVVVDLSDAKKNEGRETFPCISNDEKSGNFGIGNRIRAWYLWHKKE